ncbi:hypothetical protein [Mesobacillus jeotgali]|uniref:Uncharacterized protein n=1 Tax=Mesobacillus jeotgali TaxID=129985 RepID=A0ABY9VEB7_9BACI|nr:hypothetical protein [Mesobacillus jeotgali]WNF21216.1 hypothetical protein RH061_13505 [Mesobacillus jeotgali]
MKTVYHFDTDQQFLKIDFIPAPTLDPWHAYVFDENWNDIIHTATAISDTMGEAIEYVYESLEIRGRITVLTDLKPVNSLAEHVDVSLFHLQALLFASAIIVKGDFPDLERFGFSRMKTGRGNILYILSSEEIENDSCRFL